MWSYLGKWLVSIGVIIVLAGLILIIMGKINFQPGHFPLDIYIRKKNFVFYFPLGLSLIISAVLTLLLSFFYKK